MISNHAVGGQTFSSLFIALSGDALGFIEQGFEQVSFVVAFDLLDDSNDAFETHAGIDMFFGQGLEFGFGKAVELDENVVPNFNDTITIAVHFTNMAFDALLITGFRSEIIMDFGTGTTRAGLCHFPEVVVAIAFDQMVWVKAGLSKPIITRFRVIGEDALFIYKVAGVKFAGVEPPHVDQQLPAPGDSFFFVVIAKGPVAKHFKEGVVGVIPSDGIEVVMFARNTHTFLRVGNTGSGWIGGA